MSKRNWKLAIICQVTMNKFPQWLNDQLKIVGWSQSDLAKSARIDNGVVSRLLSGERKPTPETLSAIAKAFHLPREEVFRAAGLLQKNQINERSERLAYRIGQLSIEDQAIIDDLVESMINRRRSASTNLNSEANPQSS